MGLIESVLVFAAGLAVLAKASDVIIDKAVDIGRILRITSFAVGFILLAVSTSLPELFVSLIASMQGSLGISVGNVIGSNIANLALVLGLTALAGTVVIRKKWVSKHAGVLVAVAVLPLLLFGFGKIHFVGGLLLLASFAIYCFFLFKEKEKYAHWREPALLHVLKTYAVFFAGIVAIIVSATYVVRSGAELAAFFHVPEAFIGLTVIAVGTSLPELAVSIAAVRKKQAGLAVGNILGSCVTNLTLVLGAAAVTSQKEISLKLFASSTIFLVYLSLVVWYLFSERRQISKRHAFLLLASYAIFLALEGGLIIS